MTAGWSYEPMRALVAHERLPVAIVDLDILDANVGRLRAIAERENKRIRLATKSVRVPALIRYVMEQGRGVIRGLMCYSLEEAFLLASLDLDDFLVAYPTVRRDDLESAEKIVRMGKSIVLMVDSEAHLSALEAFWGRTGLPPLAVCVDMDVSYRPLGGAAHLGVRRSPIRSIDDFCAVIAVLREKKRLRLAGVMAYEAQIAGVTDRNPFSPLLNPAKRMIKTLSRRDVAAKRARVSRLLEQQGVKLEFFNGGGTGSIRTTAREPWITEVTAGSGFLQSHLFDYYRANENAPAFCFALQVSRVPEPGVVTCLGGGYVASGESSPDKAPVPFLPRDLKPFPREGFGEVQTPLINGSGYDLKVGDPVFFRPAKAGEIAERFSEYLLVRQGRIVDRAKTYRGMGHCFF
ncbi:MAG: alanine racemase [Acidobacteriota bacterium]